MKKFGIALKIKAKHGKLQTFIDKMGWNQSDFARAVNLTPSTIGNWFNLKDFPRSEELMEKVCKLVGETPTDLFPEYLRDREFLKISKVATIHKEINLEFLPFSQVPQLSYTPDYDTALDYKVLHETLKTLTPKEEQVLRLRFGLGKKSPRVGDKPAEMGREHTLEETGRIIGGVSRTRARQIEAKALKKLRHPSRLKVLLGEKKKNGEDNRQS